MLRGGGFWPEAARRWLLARCCAAVASCPMRRGGGFLPDAARRCLLARCCAAVASCRWLWCHLLSNILRTDSESWGCQSFGNATVTVEHGRRCRRRTEWNIPRTPPTEACSNLNNRKITGGRCDHADELEIQEMASCRTYCRAPAPSGHSCALVKKMLVQTATYTSTKESANLSKTTGICIV